MPTFVPSRTAGAAGGHFVPSRAGAAGGGHFVPSGGAVKRRKKGRHGPLGFVENLGADIGGAAAGIGPGLALTGEVLGHDVAAFARHPIGYDPKKSEGRRRIAIPLAKSYEQTYGPLTHGDISKFLHTFYQHPLGPILDVATIATLGSAGAAKAGLLPSEAGTIALRNEAALVRAGRLKGFEATAERQLGRTLKTKRTSRNPAIRARQVAVDKALKLLPPETPGLGEVARYNRELDRLVRHGPLKLAQQVTDYRRAYSHLGKWENVAFHLHATAVRPEEYAAHLEREFAGRAIPAQAAKTVVLMRDPKLLKAFEEPSARLREALAQGRKLEGQLREDHMQRGTWSPAFEDRPYLHNRIISGARFNRETGRFEGGTPIRAGHDVTVTPPPRGPLGDVSTSKLQTRLDALNKRYDDLVEKLSRQYNAGIAKGITASRNIARGKAARGRSINAARRVLPTVREDARSLAESQLLKMLESHAHEPLVRRLRGEINEAQAIQEELALRSDPIFGGHEPSVAPAGPTLEQQITSKGLEQPFYLPDIAATRRLRDALQRSGGGKGIPKAEAALHQNAGIMFNTARLAMHPETLDRAFMAHTRFVLHDAIHDALVQNAVRVPVGHSLPKGWTYIRRKTRERVPATERVQGDVMERLGELVPDTNAAYEKLMTRTPAEAEGEGAYRLAVREATVRQLAGEFKRSEHFFNVVFRYPTQAWRALVLGARVGFFTNNVVGNSILYGLRFAGIDGVRAYLRTLREVRGPDVVRRLLRREAAGKPEFRALYEEFAPELAQGTFGRTQFEGLGRRLSQGLGPLTARVAEDIPREAGFRAAISPAVRAAMRADGRRFLDRMLPDTRTFNEYARKALERDPRVAREAVDKVNDALGNYLNLTEFERRTVRGLIPFYGWLRAITTITVKTALNTPGRALALTRIGQVGTEWVQERVGPVPDFLLGLIPIGPRRGGAQTVLSTQGLNPFATIPQVTAGVGGLLGGRPGDTGRAASQLGINPFLGGAVENLSGKQLFTGKDTTKGPPVGLPGAIAMQVAGGVPPAQLIQALRGHGRVSKLYGQQGARAALLSYLGVPVKQLDVAQANYYARR